MCVVWCVNVHQSPFGPWLPLIRSKAPEEPCCSSRTATYNPPAVTVVSFAFHVNRRPHPSLAHHCCLLSSVFLPPPPNALHLPSLQGRPRFESTSQALSPLYHSDGASVCEVGSHRQKKKKNAWLRCSCALASHLFADRESVSNLTLTPLPSLFQDIRNHARKARIVQALFPTLLQQGRVYRECCQ